MESFWRWVLILVVALCIVGLLATGRSERQDYWSSKGARVQHAQVTSEPIAPQLHQRRQMLGR